MAHASDIRSTSTPHQVWPCQIEHILTVLLRPAIGLQFVEHAIKPLECPLALLRINPPHWDEIPYGSAVLLDGIGLASADLLVGLRWQVANVEAPYEIHLQGAGLAPLEVYHPLLQPSAVSPAP